MTQKKANKDKKTARIINIFSSPFSRYQKILEIRNDNLKVMEKGKRLENYKYRPPTTNI